MTTSRIAACLALVLIAGCVGPQGGGGGDVGQPKEPKVVAGPFDRAAISKSGEPRLEDRSRESDYNLSKHAAKLEQAEAFARQNSRAAAVFILSNLRKDLGEDLARERLLIDIKIAEAWGCEGEGRDSTRASALLDEVELLCANDARLAADVQIARLVLARAEKDWSAADLAAKNALARYDQAGAHARYVEAARFATVIFLGKDDFAQALYFARLGRIRALQIDKAALNCATALDCAGICFRAGADAQAGEFLDESLAAAAQTELVYYVNLVVAEAVRQYARLDQHEQAIRWGDVLRDRDKGELPALENWALDAATWARTLALYALCANQIEGKKVRAQEALSTAKEALEAVLKEDFPAEVHAEMKVLKEKVAVALAKLEG